MNELLNEIEQFLNRFEGQLSATGFGQSALGDRHLVFQLRNGRELRSSTVNKVRQFMSDFETLQALEKQVAA